MQITKTLVVIIALLSIARAASAQDEPNDLSAYYGFKDIEILKLDWGIGGLTIADFNGDGRNDIAVANNRKARIDIRLQKDAIGPAEEQVAVSPEDVDINALLNDSRFELNSVAVSQKVQVFVCGDLNSDGMPDLAFYGEPKGLYIILQKKEADAPPSTLNWGTRRKIDIDDGLPNPNALLCADMNNDGRDDLVLAGKSGVYLLFQQSDGSLAEPVKYPTQADILGLEVGDLDGDGTNDLIQVTGDGEKPVCVRFGRSTGQLGPELQFAMERPWVLAAKNIDAAPDDEILIVDGLSGRLTCCKLAPDKRGDADWPMFFYPLETGEATAGRDLEIADFDGDGLCDLVVSDTGAAELIFYKQIPDAGLAEPVKFPTFSDVTNLSVADIDHDGRRELAQLSVKEKIIGLSRFEDARFTFPKPLQVEGEPVAMELADLDSDGQTDCLYISRADDDTRTLKVIYSAGISTDADKTEVSAELLAAAREANRLWPDLKLEKLTSNPDGLKILDVDRDGLQDVLIFVRFEAVPLLVRQTAKRRFELIDSPAAQASLLQDASPASVAPANLDAKPGDELLVAQKKNFARGLIFADAAKWEIVDQYNAKSPDDSISAVAIDAPSDGGTLPHIMLLDGRKGLLQLLKAGADSTYRVERELKVGKWTQTPALKMLTATLAADGSRSILLFDTEKFALINRPTAENPARTLQQQFTYQTKIKDGTYGNLACGDINSDGRPDVIMVEYKGNHIEILALDADNNPVPAVRFRLFEQKSYREENRGQTSVEPREMKIADVTGDGRDDLIALIHDRLIIYPQD